MSLGETPFAGPWPIIDQAGRHRAGVGHRLHLSSQNAAATGPQQPGQTGCAHNRSSILPPRTALPDTLERLRDGGGHLGLLPFKAAIIALRKVCPSCRGSSHHNQHDSRASHSRAIDTNFPAHEFQRASHSQPNLMSDAGFVRQLWDRTPLQKVPSEHDHVDVSRRI